MCLIDKNFRGRDLIHEVRSSLHFLFYVHFLLLVYGLQTSIVNVKCSKSNQQFSFPRFSSSQTIRQSSSVNKDKENMLSVKLLLCSPHLFVFA